MALTSMAFVACGGDDEPEPEKAPTLKTPAFAEQASSISISDLSAPYSYIEFTESGRAVLKLRKADNEVKTRVSDELISYIAGTFAWDGNKYTIYGSDGKIICTVKTAKTGNKVSVSIEMPDGTTYEVNGTIASKSSVLPTVKATPSTVSSKTLPATPLPPTPRLIP